MIKVYPYEALAHIDHGWLRATHHFSFAQYWDPERIRFGTLRVVNDDLITASHGFSAHSHDNMEIITYVKKGAITHEDNMGNEGCIRAGNMQVMSAGSGITHSEHNAELQDTELYQIWILPNKRDVKPRWETLEFPKTPVLSQLTLLVSGMAQHAGTNALFINQDAAIYGGNLSKGTTVSQHIEHQAYMLVSRGSVKVNGIVMNQGDGAEIINEKEASITAITEAEVLVIDVPQR